MNFSDLFERLGLIINPQALVLNPYSILPYLDITINLKSKRPYLPKDKTKLQSKVIKSPRSSLQRIEEEMKFLYSLLFNKYYPLVRYCLEY